MKRRKPDMARKRKGILAMIRRLAPFAMSFSQRQKLLYAEEALGGMPMNAIELGNAMTGLHQMQQWTTITDAERRLIVQAKDLLMSDQKNPMRAARQRTARVKR